MQIKIYGRPNCHWCDSAKALLDRRGVAYTYLDLIDLHEDKRATVFAESGMRTVPIVQIDGEYIGGFNQLEEYINGV